MTPSTPPLSAMRRSASSERFRQSGFAPRTPLCEQNGRAFLRNVRHGLYLLPFSVRANIGIGCPIDPAFALGGLRAKNPYGEKLEAAAAAGLAIDDALWQRFA